MLTHPSICPHCGASDDPWLMATDLKNIDTLTWDCCGATETLTPSHYLLTFGKYKGLTLAEITDEWYLNFLGEMDKDWFLARCLELKKI